MGRQAGEINFESLSVFSCSMYIPYIVVSSLKRLIARFRGLKDLRSISIDLWIEIKSSLDSSSR